MRCWRGRREDLTCWRGGDDEPAEAAASKAEPAPVMDVTSVVRRLRAEPLSPRVQPTYAASGDEIRSPMGRTASAPVAGALRAPANPAPPLEPNPGWAMGARACVAAAAVARAGGSSCGSSSGGFDAPGGKPEACAAAPPRAAQAFANPFAASSPSEPACLLESARGERANGGGCSAGGSVGVGGCAAPEAPSGGMPSRGELRAALAQGACGGQGGASAAGEGARQPCSAACSGCLNCVGIKVPLQSRLPVLLWRALHGRTSMFVLGHACGPRVYFWAADMLVKQW